MVAHNVYVNVDMDPQELQIESINIDPKSSHLLVSYTQHIYLLSSVFSSLSTSKTKQIQTSIHLNSYRSQLSTTEHIVMASSSQGEQAS